MKILVQTCVREVLRAPEWYSESPELPLYIFIIVATYFYYCCYIFLLFGGGLGGLEAGIIDR